jgi:hypothetical protein
MTTTPCSSTATFDAEPAFEIGWDFAHHRLVPPAEQLLEGNPIRHGWEAGQAVFGVRTLRQTPYIRKWLQLRLGAWMRGKVFDLINVTPGFLERIDVPVCPITGEELSQGTGLPSDASVDRVNNMAGYAAGNLAVMSARANGAKSSYDWRECAEFARQIEVGGLGQIDGLTAGQWASLTALSSLCTPLSHAEAACMPLLLMPPPGVRVLNPAQALQAVLTMRFTQPGKAPQIDQMARLFPGGFRPALHSFMGTLLARRVAAGPRADAATLRRSMQTAWANPALLRRWQDLAMRLGAGCCEHVVGLAVARGLADSELRCLLLTQATAGWSLETEGRVAEPAVASRATPATSATLARDSRLPSADEGSTSVACPPVGTGPMLVSRQKSAGLFRSLAI